MFCVSLRGINCKSKWINIDMMWLMKEAAGMQEDILISYFFESWSFFFTLFVQKRFHLLPETVFFSEPLPSGKAENHPSCRLISWFPEVNTCCRWWPAGVLVSTWAGLASVPRSRKAHSSTLKYGSLSVIPWGFFKTSNNCCWISHRDCLDFLTLIKQSQDLVKNIQDLGHLKQNENDV